MATGNTNAIPHETEDFWGEVAANDPMFCRRCQSANDPLLAEVGDLLGGVRWGHTVNQLIDEGQPDLFDSKFPEQEPEWMYDAAAAGQPRKLHAFALAQPPASMHSRFCRTCSMTRTPRVSARRPSSVRHRVSYFFPDTRTFLPLLDTSYLSPRRLRRFCSTAHATCCGDEFAFTVT